ncbi:P-loop containing nucleoside triphosphate hydrolase protein [Trametes maxima]|nr:P-loop containing nucleoside triphosphate hydrolase protein [Trametes maxima]
MSAVPPRIAESLPTVAEIQCKTLLHFGRRPCLWQCNVVLALLQRSYDVVCISGTGSGKTLTFWMPLLFCEDGIQVVITPLNILGNQNTVQLERLGIRAIAISAQTATIKNFQDIALLKYRVVVVNPEEAFKPKGGFARLWRNKEFISRLMAVVWDEAHCIKNWASFRKDYGDAGRLRNILNSVPYLMPSATLPELVLKNVIETLRVQKSRLVIHRRSNDRPNIYLTVRKMQHPASSFRDLDFVLPVGWKPGNHIPKFLVFFDNIEESIQAADVLRRRLPSANRYKVLCFNSDTTASLREEATAEYISGELWGLYCTDSFGMGIDIEDIELVVQWKVTCDLDSLWQRFGRAARGPGREAVAVLLAEPKYFDEEKAAAEKRAEARAEKRKEGELIKATTAEQRKRKHAEDETEESTGDKRPSVRQRMADGQVDSESAGLQMPELSQYEQLRIAYKTSWREAETVPRKRVTESAVLSPELDNLVNVATRPFKCFRVPITAYYENDRVATDSRECLHVDGDGCARCRLLPSTICCSLCSPNHPIFAFLPAPSTGSQTSRSGISRASNVVTKYTMTTQDHDFRVALHQFRRVKTLSAYGRAILNNMGPGMVLGDNELIRIANCARAHKIVSVEDLFKETKWDLSWEHGDEVVALVKQYYPPAPAPLATTPLRAQVPAAPSETIDAPSEGLRVAVARRCGACSQVGHTRRSKQCPNYGLSKPRSDRDKNEEHALSGMHTPAAEGAPSPTACNTPTAARASGYNDFWTSSLFGAPSYTRRVATVASIVAASKSSGTEHSSIYYSFSANGLYRQVLHRQFLCRPLLHSRTWYVSACLLTSLPLSMFPSPHA